MAKEIKEGRLYRPNSVPLPQAAIDIDADTENCMFDILADKKDWPAHLLTKVDLARGDDWGAIAIRNGTAVVLAAAAGGSAQINREWINALYAGRKAERELLATAFETIARAHGAMTERSVYERNPGYHSGSVSLRIALKGVGANIDFSSLHGGGAGLIHWFNSGYPSRALTQHFASAVHAMGNRSPHKATSFYGDWYGVAMAFDRGLQMAARGEAFDEPSAP